MTPGCSLIKLEITSAIVIILCLCAAEPQDRQPKASRLPAVFTPVLADVKAECHLPILLPSELPKPIADAQHALMQRTTADRYSIELYYELEIGDAGFAATFAGESKPKYSASELGRKVELAHGISGSFRPVSCGGSCAPVNLWWEVNGILYTVQLRLSSSSSEKSQQETITAVASSAILAGPR